MGRSIFRPGLFLSPEGAAALEISDQALREKAHQDAQKSPCQHVAGPVDIEVEPGEGDDQGQHEGRDPETAFRREEGPHGGKGDAGVAGGEGIVPRAGDQEPDGVVQVAGPGPGDEGLQDTVADRKLQQQRQGQHQPGAPGLRDQQQDQGQGDPDLPVVAEGREDGQHRVQEGAAAALLDAVQDAELQCLHGILPAFRAFCPFLSLMIAQDRDFGKSRSLFQGLKSPVSVRRGQEAKISASAAS